MCGIAGIVPTRENRIAPSDINSLFCDLSKRGPDDRGVYLWSKGEQIRTRDIPGSQECGRAELCLLHTRLAILDLTENGWQPMSTDDSRFHIVFNGEIYNYVELRRELERDGETFSTTSDTEVLLKGFAKQGPDFLASTEGMFAFACFDAVKQQVTLARDSFGIKPLYFSHSHRGLVFASQVSAILAIDATTRKVSRSAVYNYLRYGLTDCGSQSLVEDIYQLRPAHWTTIDLSSPQAVKQHAFWKPKGEIRDISFDDACEEVRSQFLRSVSIHLRSDVPLGFALSGGVDSSAIASAARHIMGPDVPLQAVSYLAEADKDPTLSEKTGAAVNEEPWVNDVAQTHNISVHKVQLSKETVAALLPDFLHAQDGPVGTMSPVAQYAVFERARQAGLKVMLDGQGADEIFGGYSFFYGARLASLIRNCQVTDLIAHIRSFARQPDVNPWTLTMLTAQHLLPNSVQDYVRGFVGRDVMPSSFNRDWFSEAVGDGVSFPRSRDKHTLNSELRAYVTSKRGLGHLLRMDDRNSMSFSIESRLPFLTPSFVDSAITLPERFVISPDGVRKHVFRSALQDIVPASVLNRKDKIGFRPPERDWLPGIAPLIREVVGSAPSNGPIQPTAIMHLLDRVLANEAKLDFYIWRSFNLCHWLQSSRVSV